MTQIKIVQLTHTEHVTNCDMFIDSIEAIITRHVMYCFPFSKAHILCVDKKIRIIMHVYYKYGQSTQIKEIG
jgi:hypothetical protein